ncbi:MAG: 2-phopspho-L-lactate transferase [Actinomycetota bacterium]|jgi:LPPG:FO 2-phospho-L-lactate transferase
MYTVLAGGVGAARFLRGMQAAGLAGSTVAVVNTGDDTVMHGLSISPDIDTVTYTLAAAIDPERGWGLRGETWRAMEALARFSPARPAASTAGGTWFNLGDADLATHMYRTARLAEGATLAQVTDEIRRAFGVDVRIVPMSDTRVSTVVTLAGDGNDVSFQEYFVRLRHDVPVSAVRFDGAKVAEFTDMSLLTDSRAVVIAPSNPVVSIGPIRALAGVDRALADRRDSVVAVSPIVAGAALKGPADRMLVELGMEPTVVGVARLYSPVCGTLVIDEQDAHLASSVEECGVRCIVTDTIMSRPGVAESLARTAVDAAGGGS